MTRSQIVSLLFIAITASNLIINFRSQEPKTAERPAWLLPFWIRAAIPLTVATGLWFDQVWAWWVAVVMSAGMITLQVLAGCVLALGGHFTKAEWEPRLIHFVLFAAVWTTALALLLRRF